MKQDNIFSGKYRNEPCGCKSGKKFKRCCLPKFQGYINVDNMWIKTDLKLEPVPAKIV